MKISDFNFNLPNTLIATDPVSPRDHSRLLVLNKKSGAIEHKKFYDFLSYLNRGDLLILNNSKVFPARLIGKTKKTGRKIEVFLLSKKKMTVWKCLIGGKKIEKGLIVKISEDFFVKVIGNNSDGTWMVDFFIKEKELMSLLGEYGKIPLPPYIEKKRILENRSTGLKDDEENYQTVFADDKKSGSVAAPTAGLHFTPELIERIKERGVGVEYITLHVGMGTFAPVKVDDPKNHKMHSEWVEIKKGVAEKINKARDEGGKVIAVGTTTTRALEALVPDMNQKSFLPASKSKIKNLNAWVDIFIYPGYEFKIIDAMITNFHLPKSSLIMLVSALAGKKNIDKAYNEAIKNNYRFYSYGDAMFIE